MREDMGGESLSHKRIAEILGWKFDVFVESKFIGSCAPATTSSMCDYRTTWASNPLDLASLENLVQKYTAPIFYVQSIDSPLLRAFARRVEQTGMGLKTMRIKEAPILGWGDLPTGIYWNGKDYFLIDGERDK